MTGVIVSKQHKVLLVPHSAAVENMFPGAKRLEQYAVVPHRLPEFLILRHLGFQVPNPILSQYDWVNGKPFSVQKATCAMLAANRRAYVLNDMGTGKTRCPLWTWDYLHGNGFAKKMLVVAPLSTLNFVWAREAFATLPHRRVAVLHGPKQKRLDLLSDPETDIFIINHDGVGVVFDELMDLSRKTGARLDTLVLDELAIYRNNSARSKAMRRLARQFTWVWGMTGAPMPHEVTDVWGEAQVVNPDKVPRYFSHAREMLMTRQSQFKWIPKPGAVEIAFKMMQPSVRFSLDDVVELPEVIHRTIDVPLTPNQEQVYDKIANELYIMYKKQEITAVNAGVALNKLLQVSAGWVYAGNGNVVPLDCTPRIEALVDLINSAAKKVLVFVPFRHALAGISDALTKAKIDHAVVHGGVTHRDEIFNAFQTTGQYKVCAAHPACMAHGLTLTAADTIIWYCPPNSLEVYEQANARIRRVGQHHKQQVLHLQGTPVERKMYGILRRAQRIQDQLLGLFEEASQKGLKAA